MILEHERKYELDNFQKEAIEAIENNRSVLVAAPTGSGKTLVGEHALYVAMKTNQKAFYTTPLKALSNQKYNDFCSLFGKENVGLLTGDISINKNAPIVVMTTEIIRNMIYESSENLFYLKYIILDEVHYLQNHYRGSVWEEVIIHAPNNVNLICLSATVSNAEEFGEWLRQVRGDTDVIIEEDRPVELQNLYLVAHRRSGKLKIYPTFKNNKPNKDAEALDFVLNARGFKSPIVSPKRNETVEFLQDKDYLPAIYFIFSRKGCERAAISFLHSGQRLTNEKERKKIRKIAEEQTSNLCESDLSILGYEDWLATLESGVAAHHSGLVPQFKQAVELCFECAAIKVVFATETLSLGINMPARSVVIEKLSKYNGFSNQRLTPGEYTQFTGRAGRRGIDHKGYGIVPWSPTETFSSVASLASKRTYELKSSFRPTYNMVINMISHFDQDQAHSILKMSFAQFQYRKNHKKEDLLTTIFDEIASILESKDYIKDWNVTKKGQRLSRIYHESDFVISQCLENGVFDDLGFAELAGLISVFCFESKFNKSSNQPKKLPANFEKVLKTFLETSKLEDGIGILPSKVPDPSISKMIQMWAEGQELAKVMEKLVIAPGDFVRSVKITMDLLKQISSIAPNENTQVQATKAADSLWRGVVAASHGINYEKVSETIS